MSSRNDERRAKLERLKAQKEQREQEARIRAQQAELQKSQGATTASSELIDRIVKQDKLPDDLFASTLTQRSQTVQETTKVERPPRAELKISTLIVEMEIMPRRKPEAYHREIQCDLLMTSNKTLDQINEDDEFENNFNNMPSRTSRRSTHVATGLVGKGDKGEDKDASNRKEDKKETFRILSKDESKQVMKEKPFEDFLKKSSRIMERALNVEFDVIGNYFEESDNEEEQQKTVSKGDKIKKVFTFQEKEKLQRTVSSIDWSPKVNELLLASYSKCHEWKIDQPDGMIDIFSLNLRETPEMTLNCQYEVTKAMFHPFQPNIVIGATFSGYILKWDIRVNKTQPIMKSCLAKNGHNHPIYSMNIVGSENANNIVTVSTDGLLCFWNSNVFSEPKKHLSLQYQGHDQQSTDPNQKNFLNVQCMDFEEDETDKFFVGTEDYNLYQGNLHSTTNHHIDQAFKGHHAPITKCHMHPGLSQSEKNIEMSDLMLSSSMDWTVKLWYPKVSSEPLKTFESSQEYVYDVQWSPTHPSVFSSVDGDGYIDVWDINKDSEGPIVRKAIDDKPRPIHCVKWARDGKRIATGDTNGQVGIWQVDKELYMPKPEDFTHMQRLMSTNSQQMMPSKAK